MSAKFSTKLIGKRFGELVVLEDTGKRIKNQIVFLMQCDCGAKVEMRRDYFDRKQRGTKRCNDCTKSHKTQGYGEISGSWWGQRFIKRQRGLNPSNWNKSGYRKKIFETDMVAKDGWELFLKQNRKCALSGIELNFPEKEWGGTASLDRIDSSKGYTLDNVQWVHKDVNLMKNKMSNEEFINWCNLIANNFKK